MRVLIFLLLFSYPNFEFDSELQRHISMLHTLCKCQVKCVKCQGGVITCTHTSIKSLGGGGKGEHKINDDFLSFLHRFRKNTNSCLH